ncbi:unnamed protein product [Ilex paraguariensis]|uniref:Transcription factor CBF/NF-Y/archaeal histone domain-containing protein n=1 Tax=Ilex paraguariensis TaxID=185542 RepID=A0ABC8TA85_9AQUA
MAKNQAADRKRSKGRSKLGDNKKSIKTKSKFNGSNGSGNSKDEDDPEVLVVPSSSADSEDNENETEVEEEIVEEDEEEAEAKSSNVTNERSINKKEGTKKKEKNSKKEEENSSSSLYNIPMNRVSRIIKSEYSNIRITHEAVFLINKASEKFLELFCKEGYACSFLDHKRHVSYKHLSSVVSKRRRFDFLSDFVPEKVKAEDALAEISSQHNQAET